jgi:D-lactate dehydrogenase (cytochrome)
MARIELVDAETARVFNAATGAGWAEAPHLMVEFHGTEAGAKEEAARFVEIAEEFGATGARWSTLEEDRRALWRMRHDAYWTILASRPGSTAIVTDLCVPISRLAEAVEETRADIAGSGIPGPMLGHVGDGNVHAILLVKDAGEMETARRLADRMAERALRLGGTVTGEHGVGMGKLGFMDAEHGAAWDAMGALKRALDPNGTMNPGKMVRGD